MALSAVPSRPESFWGIPRLCTVVTPAILALLGYVASVLVGVSLGIVGAGGSILMVPILSYLFLVPATLATTYSLFVVGVTAGVGAIEYLRARDVDFRVALSFGVPSSLGVLVSRSLVVPLLPEDLFRISGYTVGRDQALLVLFAVLMIVAAAAMIRPRTVVVAQGLEKPPASMVGLGAAVGLVMGLVGAGGGFLIIPALVVQGRLPMRLAVGTSLVIISANSLIGFAGAALRQPVEWPLILAASLLAVGGILAGSRLAKHISGAKLKPAFGVFVLLMGAVIVVREILR